MLTIENYMTVGNIISVIREKDGRILAGKIEAIKTVNKRTLYVISYGAGKHASFYGDSVRPLAHLTENC